MSDPDTSAASHIQGSAGAAAESAAVNKTIKYNDIMTTHIFVPIAVETSRAWCNQSAPFIEDLGRRINATTNNSLETTYLFQKTLRGTPKRQCSCIQQHFHRVLIYAFYHGG